MLPTNSRLCSSHSTSRCDVRLITSRSTTLSDVDCGKFLVLKLAEDTTLILPLASSCVGGEIKGMVIENKGGFALNIVGRGSSDNNAQPQWLVGSYTYGNGAAHYKNVDGQDFGPNANVPVGFFFKFQSTGAGWCIMVGGARNTMQDSGLTRRKYASQNIPGFSNVVISWPVLHSSMFPLLSTISNTSDNNSNNNSHINSNNSRNTMYSSNDDKIFSVNTEGLYLITWSVDFETTPENNADIGTFLVVNGNDNMKFGMVTVAGSSRPVTLSSSASVYLGVGQRISISAFNASPHPINIPRFPGSDDEYVMQMSIVRIL